MGFRVELTARGEETYYNCLEYLLYYVGGTGNYQAAKNFILGYEKLLDLLEYNADGYAILENLGLKNSDYHRIHFEHMSYKIIYHIDKDVVFVDAILHDRQSIGRALGLKTS